MFALAQVNQANPLSVPALTGNFVHPNPHQGTHVRDKDNLVPLEYLHRTYQGAVARGCLQAYHALATPTLNRVIIQSAHLAVAVVAGHQNLAVIGRDHQGNHLFLCLELDAPHASGGPRHSTNIRLLEANRLAARAKQHHIGTAIGDGGAHQGIALFQPYGNQPSAAWPGKIHERGLLHRAIKRRHEYVLIFTVLRHGQHGSDPFALLQGQDVHHRPPAGTPASRRNLEYPQPIDLAAVGEAQEGVVRIGHHQVLYEVLFLDAAGGFAPPASPLCLIDIHRLGLGIT